MPVSEDQLRQLLAERSDPARHRPVPQERITARIRRARMKRAAGAGLLAIAVAAGAVSGVTLAHDHAAGHAASYSGPPLPASFTESDGAVYHQLAVTSLDVPSQRYARLTVHVGSEPVAVVMGACGSSTRGVIIAFKVENGDDGVIACQATPRAVDLSVRPGRTAVITFVQASQLGKPDLRASWQLAVYQWTPPATLRPAPAAPRLPRSYAGQNTVTGQGSARWRLAAGRSGDWPGDQTVTITVPAGTGNFGVSVFCAGAIAGRLQVHISSPGMKGSQTTCPAWITPGQQQWGQILIGAPAGRPMTLTFRFQAPSPEVAAAYAKRAASWTIAVYEEQ